MVEATPEMIALAREVMKNARDCTDVEAMIVAAIQATTERAAKLAHRMSAKQMTAFSVGEAISAAALNARQPGEGEREALREALAEAYRKGATDVHNYWVNNPGEPPRGDPEFGESASDYAAAALDIFDSAAALRATDDAGGAAKAPDTGEGE